MSSANEILDGLVASGWCHCLCTAFHAGHVVACCDVGTYRVGPVHVGEVERLRKALKEPICYACAVAMLLHGELGRRWMPAKRVFERDYSRAS